MVIVIDLYYLYLECMHCDDHNEVFFILFSSPHGTQRNRKSGGDEKCERFAPLELMKSGDGAGNV